MKRYWIGLAVILVLGTLTKLNNLSYPRDFFFDEVYHGYTATQHLVGNPDAYDPWAKSPKGKANEWTHPPLGKLAMAAAMKVIGANSIGWRVSSVIAGSLAILFCSLLALELFGNTRVSLFAGFLMSIEGLLFTTSRIAMIDMHFIASMFFCLWMYVRWRQREDNLSFILAGIGFGVALSTKWTAIYLLGIIGIDQLFLAWRYKTLPQILILKFVGGFVIIPATIYLVSYSQYFWLGFNWEKFVELQKQMWGYHTGLKASHSYASRPWQWVFNLKPVWMHVDYSQPGKIVNIYNLGNSIVLISGLFSVLYWLRKTWRRWDWSMWFLLLSYFLIWVPWTFSPRIMLFYHYAPAVPLLCISLGLLLDKWLQGSIREKYTAYFLIGLSMIWFLTFYPHNAGIGVPRAFADMVYFAIPGWK